MLNLRLTVLGFDSTNLWSTVDSQVSSRYGQYSPSITHFLLQILGHPLFCIIGAWDSGLGSGKVLCSPFPLGAPRETLERGTVSRTAWCSGPPRRSRAQIRPAPLRGVDFCAVATDVSPKGGFTLGTSQESLGTLCYRISLWIRMSLPSSEQPPPLPPRRRAGRMSEPGDATRRTPSR